MLVIHVHVPCGSVHIDVPPPLDVPRKMMGTGVFVGEDVRVRDGVGVGVRLGLEVLVAVSVLVGMITTNPVGDGVDVTEAVGVDVKLGPCVGVGAIAPVRVGVGLEVCVGDSVGVTITAGVEVSVAVSDGVPVAGGNGHPLRAAFTTVTISSTVTAPSPLMSPGHCAQLGAALLTLLTNKPIAATARTMNLNRFMVPLFCRSEIGRHNAIRQWPVSGLRRWVDWDQIGYSETPRELVLA